MKKILDLMEQKLKAAFTACGYEDKFAKVVLSNRPDLCEYQCNGAMAAAKAYKTKPIDIANAVVEKLTAEREQPMFWRSSGCDAWFYQSEAVRGVSGRLYEVAAYKEAVEQRYRFFSFGDAMFIG